MERQKKSCSCFGIFSKKIPKKVDQGTEARQVIRSSLVNFSSSHFNAEENPLNNSLSATQKLHSSIPLANTLTSPLCRTPSMFQFSSTSLRQGSGKPCTSVKGQSIGEIPQRKNSLPVSQVEEIFKEDLQGNRFEEKKMIERRLDRIPSTESSVVLIQEKSFNPAARSSLITFPSSLPVSLPCVPKEVQSEERKEVPQPQKLESTPSLEVLEKCSQGLHPGLPLLPSPIEKTNNPKEEEKKEKEEEEKKEEGPKNFESQQFSKILQVPEISPLVVVCEIIEELDEKSKSVSLNGEENKFFPFISKEEPVINTKTENFQIDVELNQQEEPVFLRIVQKRSEDDEPPPEPDFTSPLLPVTKILGAVESEPGFTPNQLIQFKYPEPILDSNFFIKEAAKKSFENLVNRISSDKKFQNQPEKVKFPENPVKPIKLPLKPLESLIDPPKIQAPLEHPQLVPRKVDLKFKNSQEILKEMFMKPKNPSFEPNANQKYEYNNSLASISEVEKPVLNHSKSLSLANNNTVIVHESKDYSRRLSIFTKDFEYSYSGKQLKHALSPTDFSNKNLISPRYYKKRLPSLKISPIKSILSADDYSDILSFLKNSPRSSPKADNPKIDSKKYKLPALKPITPHYFNKKRNAPQPKQKARILIEHL